MTPDAVGGEAPLAQPSAAGRWPPSGWHDRPDQDEEILAALFGRLAEAAAAHDGEAAGDIFRELG
jgi:hypothetical protein